MHDTLLLLGMLGALFAVPACAEDIAPEGGPDGAVQPPPLPGDPDAGPPVPVGDAVTVRNPDGTYTTRVDATSADQWQYVDLETGVEVTAADGWDLAAQRFHIKVNGGASGPMGGAVAPIADAVLDAVKAVPGDGFITDTAEKPAFEQGAGWYDYDEVSHLLTPFPIVWVVKISDGSHVKLVIESYYDGAGTSGHFTWRWAPLAGGTGS
jgi:hypothetical protein